MSVTTLKLAQLSLSDSPTWTGTHTFSNAIVAPATQTFNASKLTIGSQATGDILYASSGSAWSRLGIGIAGQALQLASGIPSWVSQKTSAPQTDTSASNGIEYFSKDRMCNCIKISGTVYEITENGTMAAMNSVSADNSNKGDVLSLAPTASLKIGTGHCCLFGWMKFASLPAQLQPMISTWNNPTNSLDGYFLGYDNGTHISMFWNTGSGTVGLSSTTVITTGVWYHIAAFWDSVTAKWYLYTNGVLEATSSATSVQSAVTTTFMLAGCVNNSSWCVNGKLAMVGKISGIANTSAQAFATFLYGNGRGRSSAAIINWLFQNSYPTLDALYAFETPTNLGLDYGPNGNNLSKAYSIGPTTASGPGIFGS